MRTEPRYASGGASFGTHGPELNCSFDHFAAGFPPLFPRTGEFNPLGGTRSVRSPARPLVSRNPRARFTRDERRNRPIFCPVFSSTSQGPKRFMSSPLFSFFVESPDYLFRCDLKMRADLSRAREKRTRECYVARMNRSRQCLRRKKHIS